MQPSDLLPAIEAQENAWARCHICGGDGWIMAERESGHCPICGGTGRIVGPIILSRSIPLRELMGIWEAAEWVVEVDTFHNEVWDKGDMLLGAQLELSDTNTAAHEALALALSVLEAK